MKKLERMSPLKVGPTTKYIPAQNHWMALLPFEVQFTAAVDFPTLFVLEKSNYQLMGSIRNPFDPCSAPTKHEVKNLSHLITLRIFSLNNLQYRWSLYKKHDSGQEQYLESCPVDFKAAIEEANKEEVQVPVSGSSLKRLPSPPTPSPIGILSKDFTLTFKGTGINIRFRLYVSDQKSSIDSAVDKFVKQVDEDKRLTKSISHIEPSSNNIPIETSQNFIEAPPAIKGEEVTAPVPENAQTQLQQTPVVGQVKDSETPQAEETSTKSKESVKKGEEVPKEEPPKEQIQKQEENPKDGVQVQETIAGSVYNPDYNPEQTLAEPPKDEAPAESQLPRAPAASKASKIRIKTIIAVLILVAAGLFGALYLRSSKTEEEKGEKKKRPKAKGRMKNK